MIEKKYSIRIMVSMLEGEIYYYYYGDKLICKFIVRPKPRDKYYRLYAEKFLYV